MNKKGKSTRLDMNDLEKEFLTWYKNKFPEQQHYIFKNVHTETIWTSKDGKDKITYTTDFFSKLYSADMHMKVLMIEVKGWSRSNELWDQKRKLVIDYFNTRKDCIFKEYRKLGKEFFEYNQWLFETKKRKAIKKYDKEITYLIDSNNKIDYEKYNRKMKHNTKMLALWKSKVWAE